MMIHQYHSPAGFEAPPLAQPVEPVWSHDWDSRLPQRVEVLRGRTIGVLQPINYEMLARSRGLQPWSVGQRTAPTEHVPGIEGGFVLLAGDVTRELHRCGFVYLTCAGVYKGEAEVSFLVPVQSYEDVDLLRSIAQAAHEESILEVTAQGLGRLIYTGGRPHEYLGSWRAVGSTRGYDAYTRLMGCIYVVD